MVNALKGYTKRLLAGFRKSPRIIPAAASDLAEVDSKVDELSIKINEVAKCLDDWTATQRAIKARDKVGKDAQILLALKYRELMQNRQPLPPFHEVEFSSFSQNGEDGVLLFLFAILGVTNRRCVEVCAGDGIECNTSNLIINFGWQGLLFDGSEENVRKGQKYYSKLPCGIQYVPPTIVHAWITPDNINSLIRERGFIGEIDLFSLDIDGNDYWIWQAINVIQPRVVVVEFTASLGLERSVTIPYRHDFKYDWKSPCCGASLPAFIKLAKNKGYRFVGINSCGINAYFVRNGLGEDSVPEVRLSDIRKDIFSDQNLDSYPIVDV